MCGHVSAGFFHCDVLILLTRKVNTTVFVIMLKVNFLNRQQILIPLAIVMTLLSTNANSLDNCNNMTKTVVFTYKNRTSQQNSHRKHDHACATKFCIIYASTLYNSHFESAL